MAKRDYDTWSKEDLIREVEKLEKKLKKNYGLVWEDKLEDVARLCKEKLPILEEDAKKEIEIDSNMPVNILIEGDNYHALSVLNYTHKSKIDVIYIDPPYNTGNGEAFKYNDKIVDIEDGYRHSKWLSFIEKRLKLARNLLKNNGVIFISIDDNEQAQLKVLCDETFGEKNYLATVVWKKKYTGGRHSKYFVDLHEYILAYAKNKNYIEGFSMKRPEGEKQKFVMTDKYYSIRGRYYIRPLKSNLELRPTLIYPIKCPDGSEIKTQWICAKSTFEELKKDGRILFKKKRNGEYQIYRKYYENDQEGEVKVPSIIDFTSNNEAKIELKNIFRIKEGRENVLYTVKPTKLIKFLINLIIAKRSNALVLDFFAGSGTTGHSVMQLNEKDKGMRKFIICTSDESNICSEVCYPRISKIIKGYKDLRGRKVKGFGGNLKYFRTAFVDAKPTDRNKKRLVDRSTEMICLKEDCFDEVKKGKDFRVFKNSQNKYLGIIYDDEGIEVFKKEAKKMKKKFVVYVFSLDESAREEEFEDMADMVQLKPIPAVILNVYKRIFK